MGRCVLTSKSKRAARRVRVEDVLADLIFTPQCLAEYARLTGRAYDVRIATALREDLSKNGTLASHRGDDYLRLYVPGRFLVGVRRSEVGLEGAYLHRLRAHKRARSRAPVARGVG